MLACILCNKPTLEGRCDCKTRLIANIEAEEITYVPISKFTGLPIDIKLHEIIKRYDELIKK